MDKDRAVVYVFIGSVILLAIALALKFAGIGGT
jgi:hypothetical protein